MSFAGAFTKSVEGRYILSDPDILTTQDWHTIMIEFNKLGYGMHSIPDTRNTYRKLAEDCKARFGGYILNPDMQESLAPYLDGLFNKTDLQLRADELARKAEEKYGETDDIDLAGYITIHGCILNFSEDGCQRTIVHRDIAKVLDLPDSYYDAGSRTKVITTFMQLGNIRCNQHGFEIMQKTDRSAKTGHARLCRRSPRKVRHAVCRLCRTGRFCIPVRGVWQISIK